MEKQDRIRLYEDAYLADVADAGFELELIKARRRLALELLESRAPGCVLEIGCGAHPLHQYAAALSASPRRWVIVEPAEAFADIAQRAEAPGIELEVVRGFFEDRSDEVAAACGDGPHLVLCLGVLQSVPDPRAWLELVRAAMPAGAGLLLTVANALSLHRRLARAMGLIADEHELSDRDRDGFHHEVLDRARLRSLVGEAGFSIEDEGGYFVKPFTHAQMETMRDVLTPEVLDGLWQVGREMPDIASEIYVTAGTG